MHPLTSVHLLGGISLTGRVCGENDCSPRPIPPSRGKGGQTKKLISFFCPEGGADRGSSVLLPPGRGDKQKSLFPFSVRKVGRIEEASFFFPWERGTDQEAFRGRTSKFFAGMRKAKVSRKKEGRSNRVFAGEGIRDEVVSCPLRAHAPGREKDARKGDFLPPLILVLRGEPQSGGGMGDRTFLRGAKNTIVCGAKFCGAGGCANRLNVLK